MNSKQYEELCRFFLANELGMNVDEIRSVHIPNPQRPGLPEYQHQIDLYWEIDTELSLYLNIANAKWRGSAKVDQPDVMLLQKVKEKVGAHKALMITNSAFTSGAVAAAKDDGIGLHLVQPDFDFARLETKDRATIQHQLSEESARLSRPIYVNHIEHRAFDLRPPATATSDTSRPTSGSGTGSSRSNRMVAGYSNRAITTPSNTSSRGGPQQTTGQSPGGYETRQGGGHGFGRTKG